MLELEIHRAERDETLTAFAREHCQSSDLLPPIAERVDPESVWYVVEESGIVGLSVVSLAEETARISILCVDPSRGRDVHRRALLEHVLREAASADCTRAMMTGVDIRDSAAKAFVEGMGLRMNRDGVRMEWAPRPLPEVSLSPGYRLRTYKAGDEEEWANLINRSYATTPNGTDYTAEKVLENWVNTPCFMPDGSFFVTHRRSMVGCFMAWREVNEGPRRGRLHWLAVDPDHRRRGIAKFLTVRVIRHLQAKGLTSIFLDTGHNLPVAMHMYRKLGFVETPRLFDYVRDLDQSQSGRASV